MQTNKPAAFLTRRFTTHKFGLRHMLRTVSTQFT